MPWLSVLIQPWLFLQTALIRPGLDLAMRRACDSDPARIPEPLDRIQESSANSLAEDGLVPTLRQHLALRESRLARGLSNKEIDAELFIAEKAVKSHISSILSKIYFSHRTQAAVYFVKHGGQ